MPEDKQDTYWQMYEKAIVQVKWKLLIEKLESEQKADKASQDIDENKPVEGQG